MKKFLICLATLLAGTTGVKAEFDGYTGGLSLGAILEWKLPHDGGTMTIFGEDYQPMMNFTLGSDYNDRPWGRDAELAAKIQSIDMQKGINIGNNAFYGLSNLTTVKLHGVNMLTNTDAIYCIGEGAFDACNQLANINSEILTDLRYIGRRAFATTAIKSFTVNKPSGGDLPELLTTAGGFAIDLDREHCYIGEQAFAGCDHLTTVYMKDVTPFSETYNNFLNNHTYLVVNDADVAATYRAAWSEIADQIICLEQNVVFGNETFKDICITHWDTNKDGELSYEEAFAVTTFGDAFKGDSTITEITLNDLMPFINVTIIGSGTFEGCTALEKITFPSHIEDIADDAFTGCTNLKEIHFTAVFPFKDSFTIQTNERTHIIVPDAYLSTYDNTWTDKSELIIGESHIPFQCPVTKDICVTKWDTDKDGELSYNEAAQVTSISDFFRAKAITSFNELRYFTNLTSIVTYAFDGCSNLASITIPGSVTSIGSTGINASSGVFSQCTSLKEVVFLDSDKTLFLGCDTWSPGSGMFKNCPLETIYVGRNLNYKTEASYGYSPFCYVQTLKSVTLSDKVTNIRDYAFTGCSSLSNINIPEGVTSIGSGAFEDCSNLASINIPEGVTSIGNYVFKGCSNLASINIPKGVTSIGTSAFSGCSNLASINIPEGVTSIGSSAFSGCYSLSDFTIPNSVTSIGQSAFNGIHTVILDSTTPLTYNKFSDIAVFVVPDDAVSAYKDAWSDIAHRIVGESALEWKEVTCEAQTTLPNLTEMIGAGNEGNIVKLRIKGSINSYDMMVMRNKMVNLRELDLTDATIIANTYNYGTGVSEDNVFPDFMKGKPLTKLMLPTSITRIGNDALRDCYNIKSITIPATVTSIGGYAFYDCAALNSVEIPENSQLQSVEGYAFAYTSSSSKSLKIIDFTQAQQLQTIGAYAFFRASSIESILLPSSLQSIDNYAFSACSSLTNIATNANIGNSAFGGCTALTKVSFGEGATSIGQYAFTGCSSLKDVSLPSTLDKIDTYAFKGCTSLQSIELPDSMTTLGTYAFNGCTALQSIELPDALTSLGTYAFNGCTALENAEIGMGITSVPKYLFSGCTNLKNVRLSPKTMTIQGYAFQNCTGLEEFHLPPYLTTIESGAFSGCSNLKNIYAYMPDVPTIAASTFSNYQTSNLYAPAFLWSAYYVDNGWNQFLNVLKCDLRPGDYEAFFTNKDLLFKDGEERITHDRPIVELGNQGAIIVEGASQEFTTVDMERGTTSSSLIGDNNIPMDELRVKVAVNANRWYFLCFPYEVEISECTYPGKYAWREYDAAKRATDGSTGWKNVEGNTLAANKGYIFQSNTAGTLWVKFKNPTFGGNRPQELEAHHSDNAANASWNFVGNPYTCYYNITDEDFSSPITIWNGSSYVAYRPGDDDYHLQPFEAFFVQKPEGAEAIAFNAEGRETYRQSVAVAASNARVRKEMGISAERRIVNLGISNNDTALTDRTRLVFNQKAQRAYEMECDAAKFLSDETPIQIYSIENGTQMAINERPVEGDIRLGYVAARKGSYTITAPRMDVPVTLVDNELGISFDLSLGGYTFETKKGANDKRFTLRFTDDATSILDITEETGVAIGLQEGGVNLGGVENTTVRIYGVNGMLVGEYTANGFVSLPSGTYVVTVGQKSAKVNVK